MNFHALKSMIIEWNSLEFIEAHRRCWNVDVNDWIIVRWFSILWWNFSRGGRLFPLQIFKRIKFTPAQFNIIKPSPKQKWFWKFFWNDSTEMKIVWVFYEKLSFVLKFKQIVHLPVESSKFNFRAFRLQHLTWVITIPQQPQLFSNIISFLQNFLLCLLET